MEITIVHAAVARKMLCKPVNSLIADTEFACAAGMLLRVLKVKEDMLSEARKCSDMKALQQWLLESQKDRLAGEFDTPQRNLIEMIQNYKAEENSFTGQLQELLTLGYERELIYPKGRFL